MCQLEGIVPGLAAAQPVLDPVQCGLDPAGSVSSLADPAALGPVYQVGLRIDVVAAVVAGGIEIVRPLEKHHARIGRTDLVNDRIRVRLLRPRIARAKAPSTRSTIRLLVSTLPAATAAGGVALTRQPRGAIS